jgi:uncharacterized protein
MNFFIQSFVGLLSGAAGAMGLGGGGVLLLYLTAFTDTSQLKAQGINLVFFLPSALVAIIFHIKNKLIVYKFAIPAAILGVIGTIIGTLIAGYINPKMLQKIFAILLMYLGIKEIFINNK